jgi:hypothetical protein
VGPGVLGVALDRLLKQRARPENTVFCEFLLRLFAEQHQLVRCQVTGALARCAAAAGVLDLPGQGRNHLAGDLVLDREDVR